ncbi:hypothetical protein Dimus_024497 [Dionaea muscipula]
MLEEVQPIYEKITSLFILHLQFPPLPAAVECLPLWRAVEISAATPTTQRCTNNPSISNSDFQSTPPLGVPLSSTSSKIRQRYYFAVVECDSSATADYLYKACDGLRFGGEDAYPLDLRFIPNSVEFKHQPRDVAEEVSGAD